MLTNSTVEKFDYAYVNKDIGNMANDTHMPAIIGLSMHFLERLPEWSL